jgi:hypothetical protein
MRGSRRIAIESVLILFVGACGVPTDGGRPVFDEQPPDSVPPDSGPPPPPEPPPNPYLIQPPPSGQWCHNWTLDGPDLLKSVSPPGTSVLPPEADGSKWWLFADNLIPCEGSGDQLSFTIRDYPAHDITNSEIAYVFQEVLGCQDSGQSFGSCARSGDGAFVKRDSVVGVVNQSGQVTFNYAAATLFGLRVSSQSQFRYGNICILRRGGGDPYWANTFLMAMPDGDVFAPCSTGGVGLGDALARQVGVLPVFPSLTGAYGQTVEISLPIPPGGFQVCQWLNVDGSGSVAPSGSTLSFRWSFDGGRTWSSPSSSPTTSTLVCSASATVSLTVSSADGVSATAGATFKRP